MSTPQTFKLVLTGHFAGQNAKLRGHEFKRGTLVLNGTMESVQGLVTYMGKCYQAYLEGSDELAAAQVRDKEARNGKRYPEGGNSEAGKSPDGDLGPEGPGAPEEAPTEGDGDADADSGGPGSDAGGTGHEDTGVPAPEKGRIETSPLNGDMTELKSAVEALDPDVDANWTAAGLPTMVALEHVSGGVTRKMVREAAGNWNRDAARKAKTLGDLV